MSEIKVGTKLRLLDCGSNFTHQHPVGSIVEIESVQEDSGKIEFKGGGFCWLDNEVAKRLNSHYEIIKEKENKMTKFKAGDKVKNISDIGMDLTIGKVYVVSKDVINGEIILRDNAGDVRHRDACRYELYAEGVTRENLNNHTIYVVNKPGQAFKEGTEVRLTLDDGTDCPKFSDLSGTEEWYVGIDSLVVYGTEVKPEIKEMTLEEVAELAGVDVQNLRIKE